METARLQKTGACRPRHGQRLRQPRSHNGCLTCKRRKVRCNEKKPRCGHCDRLDLRCEWNGDEPQQAAQHHAWPQRPLLGNDDNNVVEQELRETAAAAGGADSPPLPFQFEAQFDTSFPLTDLFDFASSFVDPANDLFLFKDATSQLDPPTALSPDALGTVDDNNASANQATSCNTQTTSAATNEPNVREDLEMKTPPPILEMVEIGPRWMSARAILKAMAAASLMVRDSVMAFVALQLQGSEPHNTMDHRLFYNRAAKELSRKTTGSGEKAPVIGGDLKYVLTTIFLLSYIDLLTDSANLAYSHLKLAYKAVQWSEKADLGPIEQRVISWIRILDARAASAGGEGCFVNDKSGVYLPSDGQSKCTHTGSSPGLRDAGATTTSIEEVLYDMLSGPGAVFFQEVQSITGRITKIDHYHRSRNTVSDETEVMAIAAEIQRDLARLWDHRPALMDHAFAGNVGANLLSPELARAIVCSYQTYLASFHGCYVHIHRIAHRHLPRPQEVEGSLGTIRQLMHSMVMHCKTLPVNALWPLFLWGCEEDDPQQCSWIVDTIRSLGNVTTNANNTADLLLEVQTRQRLCNSRVDVRSVAVELFKANFAIV